MKIEIDKSREKMWLKKKLKRKAPIVEKKISLHEEVIIFLKSDDSAKGREKGKSKHMPIFLTLKVGDKLFHNTMIHFKVSSIVVPK